MFYFLNKKANVLKKYLYFLNIICEKILADTLHNICKKMVFIDSRIFIIKTIISMVN